MLRLITLAICLSAVLVMAGGAAFCWEISYEGDVLPNSPELGAEKWLGDADLSLTYIENSVLRTVDVWSNGRVYFYQFPIPAGTPVTGESRLRVFSASSPGGSEIGPGLFGVCTLSGTSTGGVAGIGLFTDKVVTRSPDDSQYRQYREYAVDMTQWHTFRIALTSDNWSYVWMDGGLIFSGFSGYPPGYGQDGVAFGTSYRSTADIEWDYVRYSKEFLPIPEPASLLALAAGLLALVLRRRGT